MKKSLLIICTMLAMTHGGFALTWDDLKNEVITKTQFTATEKGGPSMFYDFADGTSGAFRVGATDHVLTNRFIQADMSWLGGTDGHVGGLAVFGGSIVLTDAIQYAFPNFSNLVKPLFPAQLQGFWAGAGIGWGTDGWRPHWIISIGKNF